MRWFTFLNTLLIGLSLSANYYLYNKNLRVTSTSKLALYSAYCNQYQIRHIWNDVLPGSRVIKSDYVMFPPVCNVQYALERLDSVKFRGEVPEYKEYLINYDSYFTGKGYGGDRIDKIHNNHEDKLIKEYEKLTKKLGIKKSLKDRK